MIILIFSLNILSIKKIIWKKKQNKKRNKEEFKIEKIFLVFFSIKWLIFKNLIIFKKAEKKKRKRKRKEKFV